MSPSSPEPLYQQVFDQIVARIRSDAFPPGYRLPPSRLLAQTLGTHRNTVVRAYAELRDAGFLTSKVGRGSFVAEQQRQEHGSAVEAHPAQEGLAWPTLLARSVDAEPLVRFDRLRRVAGVGDPVNLSRMEPPPELLPADLLGRCVAHVLSTLGPKALGYAPRDGVPRLRNLIAEDLASQGVPASPEDLLVTTGSQQALDLVGRALLNPDDRLLVQGSTYTGAIQVFAALGGRLVGVPSDEQGPAIAALGRFGGGAKALYLMPNHCNPTGECIAAERRLQILAWSRDAGVPIVEDDYAADLELEDKPPPPAMRAFDGEVIYVGTFSKKLIPALRVGFIVCPPRLKAPLVALKHTMDLGSSALLQQALAELLERGYMRAHLNRVRPTYRKRRDALEEALRKELPSTVQWQHPTRGLTLWLTLPPDLEPEIVFQEALRQGVIVSPGTLHTVERGTAHGLRLTFCFEPPERLREGARCLGRAIAAVEARRAKGRNGLEPSLGMV